MIKLVVSDLDGTLLNDAQEVPETFYAAFEQMHEKGILFAAASGRQYFNMKQVLSRIADRMVFVAENGGIIMENDTELYTHEMQREEAFKVIDASRKIPNTAIFVCGRESAYIETKEPQYVETAETYFGKYQIVSDLKQIEDKILKVSVFDYENQVYHKAHSYLKDLKGKFKLTLGGVMWYDIIPENSNKGVAVQKLQELKNITPEETMVFGDYLNDLEMMRSAKYSFAMENANSEVIAAANQICADNNSDGVAKTILEYILP